MNHIEFLQNLIEQQCCELPLQLEPTQLFQPIEYIMEDGGKRMRPTLTLLAAQVIGVEYSQAMGAAIAVEVFHNFTLLHDDIMDKASLRRGRATVHQRWNDNVAILSGDAMLILAYQILAARSPREHLPALLAVFNRAAMEVCQGQQYDMDFETSNTVTLDQYLEMIRLKTAVLMAAAMEMGAITAGATSVQCAAIYEFGISLGLAFQIQDDLLDTYGNAATFGKAIGGDIAVGKKTFLYLTAMQSASEEQIAELERSRDYNTVRRIYDSLSVKERASQAIEEYFQKALSLLSGSCFKGHDIEPLVRYADTLLGRNK